MTGPNARVPTGTLDRELRVVTRTDGPVPRLEIQPWAYSLAAGGWTLTEGPPALQPQFVDRLCEVLIAAGAAATGQLANELIALDRSVRVPLGADLELRLMLVAGEDGIPAAEAGLWRTSPNDASREYHRTHAAWWVPAHLFPVVLEGMQRIGRQLAKVSGRTVERSLFAPAAGEP